jgi:hypothetical protein
MMHFLAGLLHQLGARIVALLGAMAYHALDQSLDLDT